MLTTVSTYTRNFMRGNSQHLMTNRYKDSAVPVSYAQMMGESAEVQLNGLSCGVMSYL